jgi:putative transposase
VARLPRLTLAGQAHWIIQRAHPGARVFFDEADRSLFVAALHETMLAQSVSIHAYALLDDEVQLLARPQSAEGLSRFMQSLGRRYVSAHHRRHGGSGTLWDGRFRCAVIEAGATLLEVLCLIDGSTTEPGASSLPHRNGGATQKLLVDPPEYWLLGNTPFDRQAAWRHKVAEGLTLDRAVTLRRAAWGNWAVGSAAFSASVSATANRPAMPRSRGRPRSS